MPVASGRQRVDVFRAGHIPGARDIDWRADLVDALEDSDAIRLADPPDRQGRGPRRGRRRHHGRDLRRHPGPLRRARLVVVPGLWARAGPVPRRRVSGLARPRVGPIARSGRRDRAARHLHPARPEPDAPDDARRPRHARSADRGPARRRGPRPSTVVSRARRAASGTSRALSTCRRDDACGRQPATAQRRRPARPALRGQRQSRPADGGLRRVRRGRREARVRADAAGHEDVAVYDGGWAEWGNRLDLPVDR